MPEHTLTLRNGLQLGYAEYGDPHGEVAFYFHGWPSSRLQGSLFHEAARKHRMRLICPDRPGIGISQHQPQRTLHDWPDTIQQLAEHIGADNYHLIAWSGGGPYVLAMARLLPQRILSASIICGAPPLIFLGDREMFWIYRLMIQLRRFLPTVLSGILKMGAFIVRGEPQKFPLSLMMRMLGEEDRRVLLQPGIFEVVRAATLAALEQPASHVIVDADIYLSEWGFEVSQINLPIHFWHGKQDQNIAWTYSERLAALIPQAVTHWSEIDGHYSLPITHAEAILTTAMQKPTPSPEPSGGLMTNILRSLKD
jgi:pimeloyl-ACP methyl ester carboxylesterase